MGNMLLTCLLVLTSGALANANIGRCSELCKSMMIARTKTWPANCDCSSEDETFTQTKELLDSGIYYEPSDVYTLHRLSFFSIPFFILNPTQKVNFDSSVPKVIKKRKLSHNSKFSSSYISHDRVNTGNHNKETNKRPLYLDVDVQESVHIDRSTQKALNNKNRFNLSENDFMECVNLFKLVYFKENHLTLLPNNKNKENKSTENYSFIEPEIIEDIIKKKCSQPADIVRQSLQEIKSKISSFKSSQYIYSKEESVATPQIELPAYYDTNIIGGSLRYPNTSLLQYQKGKLENILQTLKTSGYDKKELKNFLHQSAKFKKDSLLNSGLPKVFNNYSQNSNSFQLSVTTSQDLANKENSNNTKNNKTGEKRGEKKYYKYSHTDNMSEITITTVRANQNQTEDVNNNQETKSVFLKVEAPIDQSDNIERFTTSPGSFTNQNHDQYSTELYRTTINEISPTSYEPMMSKLELNEENKTKYKQFTRLNGSFNIYNSNELFDMDIVAAKSAINLTQFSQNSMLNEEDENISTSEPSSSVKDSQLPTPRSSLGPSNEMPIHTPELVKIDRKHFDTSKLHKFNERQWKEKNTTANQFSDSYKTTQISTTSNSKDTTMSHEDNPLYKDIYDKMLSTEDFNNSNKSLATRSAETTSNDFEDYFKSTSDGDVNSIEESNARFNHTNNRVLSNTLKDSLAINESVSNDELNEEKDQINKQFTMDGLTEHITNKEEKQTTIPYMTKEEYTSTAVLSYEEKQSTDDILLAERKGNTHSFITNGWYNTIFIKNKNNDRTSGILSGKDYYPGETPEHHKNNSKLIRDSTVASINVAEKESEEKINKLSVKAKEIPEVVTKEFENDTDSSNLKGNDFFLTDYFKVNNSSNYSISIANDIARAAVSESITGKLFFVFNKTDIPAKFVQKANGDLSIGIDGATLCTKLNSKDSFLINALCKCLLLQNCTNPLLI